MQKKIIVMAISAMGAVISGGVNAQQALSPTERVVLGQENTPRQATPVQSANPMGSVQNQSANGINYGAGASLNQQHIPVSSNMLNQAAGMPVAQGQGVPMGLPSGLPAANPSPILRQNKDELSALERTMNILNTPDEKIKDLNRDLYNKSRVLNQAPTVAAKPINSVLVASLAPGSTSPVVRLSKGRTSALMITDATGKPWPIVNFDGLAEDDFVVNRLDAPAPDGYVLSVTPLGQFVSGNLVLILKDLPSPLVVEFVSAQPSFDVKTEIRVQAVGPNAVFQSLGMPESINPELLSILQGVAPQNAKPLDTNSNAVQAWADASYMYVRTRYKIQSPAPINMTSSADGTYAYKMAKVPVVLYRAGLGKDGSFSVNGF